MGHWKYFPKTQKKVADYPFAVGRSPRVTTGHAYDIPETGTMRPMRVVGCLADHGGRKPVSNPTFR